MRDRLKKIKLTWIIGIVFLVVLCLVFLNLRSRLLSSNQRLETKESGRAFFYPNAAVTQVFTAENSDLGRIMVALGKVHLNPGEAIKLQLDNEACSKVLAEATITNKMNEEFNPFDFDFPKITDSKGVSYCVSIIFSGEKRKQLSLPFVYLTKDQIYQRGIYANTGESKGVDQQEAFSLKPIYGSLDLRSEMISLDQKISQYKPWFFKGDFLYAFAILFVIAIIGLAALILAL